MLTVIGMIGVQAGLLEEKMSSNMREHDLAFEAAEMALKSAETVLKQQGESLVFQYAASNNATPGAYLSNSSVTLNGASYTLQSAYQKDDFWNGSFSSYFKSCPLCALANAGMQPEYVMEQLPQTIEAGESLETGIANQEKIYRITSHGFGASASTAITLQSTFRQ